MRSLKSWNLRALLVLPSSSNDGKVEYYYCPLLHGWSAHVCPCDVEVLEGGRKVKLRHPVQCASSEDLIAALYDRKELALPFFAWSIQNDTLHEECMLGNLGPWQPSRKKADSLMIKDAEDIGEEAEEAEAELEEDDNALGESEDIILHPHKK